GEQLAVLALHRARQGFVKARTAQANQIRGLLAEHGIIVPKGIAHISLRLPELLEDAENNLPGTFRQLIERLGEHLKELAKQVNELEEQIWCWHKENSASQKLAKMPGIGPLTASALVASIGDAKQFENGRQLAAWLGLVPKQHSSGGKQTLLGISKRGDIYLRTLLIHGARSVLRVAERKTEYAGSWLAGVMERRNHNVTVVALANKNARIIWALLAHEREYDADHAVAA
ncbi:TPA: IS110 family transposase, partial [Klebsiella pneumoniae]|nr:IS110 family transposase [Klebsiella pneumoniae]HBT7675487.1 IS110 family transposase [Klebsiella pneumoniae]HBT9210893.1 IS110 family transposase [Klebsiella pneumoniae]